jgi:hypothetical protein
VAYTGGTKAVKEFVKKYTARGLLVDVYSRKWLEAHESFPYVSVDDLDEFQEQSGRACEGHLLVLFTDDENKELEGDLLKIHKPFANIFGESIRLHKPDLVFINLATMEILCMGLGRKNQFFCYQLKDEISQLRDTALLNSLLGWYKTSMTSPSPDDLATQSFISNFVKYDYANIVANLTEALEDFGEQASVRDHLPLNDDEIDNILDNGPEANGLYLVEDEELTEEEVKNIQAEFTECYSRTREHLDTFEYFFGEIYWDNLSTGDY